MASFNINNSLNHSASTPILWGEIFESHRRWLTTIVRARLADPHAVADVLQEVALAAISQPNRPESPDKIAPWLYRITLRKIVNHHRATGRRRKLLNSIALNTPPHSESASIEPGTWLFQEEIHRSIHEGLARLSPQDRQLLLLKYTEGWSYEQLATNLGVSIKTIEYRLLKARRSLRAQLSEHP